MSRRDNRGRKHTYQPVNFFVFLKIFVKAAKIDNDQSFIGYKYMYEVHLMGTKKMMASKSSKYGTQAATWKKKTQF